jgi:hypothetical protein
MNTAQVSDADVLEIVKKIKALRRLTKETGCITLKAQNEVLRALPLDVLTRVSVLLAEDGAK